MKIAMICTEKLPVPPIAGGAVQLYIEGIVPYLSAKHDITVFSIQYPGLPDRETRNRVNYIRVPGNTGPIYLQNLKEALDNSYDLVHVFNRPRYALELMDKFPNMRFGLSLHNEMFHPEKISDPDAMKCINKVEYINTVSKYIAGTVTARFPSAAGKLRVVYSGVDALSFKPVWSREALQYRNQLKKQLNLQDRKVVLFVGRLSVKKGVDILIKAMDQVMRTNPGTALLVVGSKWYGKNETDEYTESLQAISRNPAGPIVFTGFVPPAEIPRYFALGDVFVCASQWMEPLARVHYEAMAAGLPIITTNRGGNAEVVAGYENGIVIDDYSNPAAMAQKISYLLNNQAEALRMGGNGRKLAEVKYAWERVAGEVFPALDAKARPVAAGAAAQTANAGNPVGRPSGISAEAGKPAGASPANPPVPVITLNPASLPAATAQTAAPASVRPASAGTVQMAQGAGKTPVSSTPGGKAAPAKSSASFGAWPSRPVREKAPTGYEPVRPATVRLSPAAGYVPAKPTPPLYPAYSPGSIKLGWLRKQQ